MEEKQLSEQESLSIIQRMINTAKKEQKDDGRGWIIWGWMLFMASVFSYINLYVNVVGMYFFWNAFGIVTLAVFAYRLLQSLFFPAAKKVRTYTKDLMDKLNIGFFISLGFIIVSMNSKVNPTTGFAFLICLYGFWILIYGTALNFKPSIIAAFITWAFGFAALFTDRFEYTMLLHGAAVLCGYIIPGHMANAAFKKINQPVNA